MGEKGEKQLFRLETKEELLRMKAIYRFIHASGKTPEEVIEQYLNPAEKAQLKAVEDQITMEIIKPLMDKQEKKKKEGKKQG